MIRFTLLFLAVLALLTVAVRPATAQSPFEVGPGQSGAWFDPANSGEGFLLEILDNGTAVVYWFTYDESGQPRWFIGTGTVSGSRVEVADLLQPVGTIFGDDFNAADVTTIRVGQASFDFSGCDAAHVDYQVGEIDGSQDVIRLTAIAGVACDSVQRASDVLMSGISGSWFNPARSGEGLVIEVYAPDSILVYWFTYGLEGGQAWFFGTGKIVDSQIVMEQVYAPTGPRFGPDFDPADLMLNESGGIQVRVDCDGIDYDYELGVFGSGTRSLTRLTRLAGTQCSDNVLLTQRLDDMLAQQPDPANFVYGASYAVDSEITGTHWRAQAGKAGANETDLSDSHAFKTGWLGEMFTAALALRLVEIGALSLDTLVSDYLGASAISGLVTYRGEDETDHLTIRHLLSHRSGLGDLFQEPETQVTPMLERLISEPEKVLSNEEIIDYVRQNLAANSTPGTDFLHTEVNYILLAEAIESQSGTSLAAAFRQHISEPLGMDQTWHLLQDQVPGGISLAAMQLGDTDLRQIPSLTGFDSGNAWATTTRDLGKFIHGLFEQEIFAQATTLDAMFDVHSNLLGAAHFGMGGMIRSADCTVSEAQLRGYIGTGAFAVMIPERKAAVYGFTTRLDYFGLGFMDDVLEAMYSSSRCRDVGSLAEAESPAAAGFSGAGLAALTDYLETTDSSAFLAVVGGQVVYRHGQIGRAYASHSIRKSFLSALVGNAVDEGQIELSSRLSELGINDFNPLTAQEQTATVDDLLKSRSGIYLPAAAVDPGTQRPPRGSAVPGSQFFYNNWDFNVMGTIYEQATGDSLYDRFEQEIAIPLGMQDFRVEDQFYIYERRLSDHPAYMFMISARDMARFGQLYLEQGRWNGEQIISSQWVSNSITSYSDTGSESRPGFGYMNWSIVNDGYMATGSGGHKVKVIPAENLVVVIRVDTYNEGERVGDSTFNEAVELLLQARE